MADPITAIGLAIAGLVGGGAASMMSSGAGGAVPAAPGSPPPPVQNQTGTKATPKSQQPTFVGSSAAPTSSFGQKTLLGQ